MLPIAVFHINEILKMKFLWRHSIDKYLFTILIKKTPNIYSISFFDYRQQWLNFMNSLDRSISCVDLTSLFAVLG